MIPLSTYDWITFWGAVKMTRFYDQFLEEIEIDS